MSYSIEVTDFFARQLKRLVKKYPSIKKEATQFIESLETNPQQGIFLGKSCYKIRLAISSKKKGKSGGARIITHVFIAKQTVYLLSIYDKSEQENIPDEIIESLLKQIIASK